MDVLKRIEILKKQRGWTDYRLALESGVSQSTLATMKQRNTPPKLEVLEQICDAFELSLSQFFNDDENMEILTKEESKLIQSYRRLSPKRKTALLILLEE